MSWRDQFDTMPWPLPADLQIRGFQRWASGAERLVLIHRSGWCLKVPIGQDGVLANRDEITVLGAVTEEERKLFAETRCIGGDVLLQRVYAVDGERVIEYERTSSAIARAQRRLRLSDITPTNVGWREDGSWVFIDWAGSSHPNVFYMDLPDGPAQL